MKTFDKVIYIRFIAIFKRNFDKCESKTCREEEAVHEEALKEQNPFGCDETDQLPKETEKMIDRFVNRSEFPHTLPTSTASLLSPLNENKGLPVMSYIDIGHPLPIGHSAYMTLTDTGLPTGSFPDKGH